MNDSDASKYLHLLEKIDILGCNLIYFFSQYPSPSFPVLCYTFSDMKPGSTSHSKYLQAGQYGLQSQSLACGPEGKPGCDFISYCFRLRVSLNPALTVSEYYFYLLSLKWHFYMFWAQTMWTYRDLLIMRLLEAGVLDGKLGTLFWIFVFRLCQWSSPACLMWIHSVSNKSHLNICSAVLFSEFTWMNSWINSNGTNFCKGIVTFCNIILSTYRNLYDF